MFPLQKSASQHLPAMNQASPGRPSTSNQLIRSNSAPPEELSADSPPAKAKRSKDALYRRTAAQEARLVQIRDDRTKALLGGNMLSHMLCHDSLTSSSLLC